MLRTRRNLISPHAPRHRTRHRRVGEDSHQAQEPSRELRSAARCAEVLFILCVLIAIATLALNRALSENKLEHHARYQWYQDTGSMLARVRASRDRSPRFFEGLVLSALTQGPAHDETTKQYPSLAALGPIDISRRPDDGSIAEFGSSANDALLFELMSAATEFGGLAAQIVANAPDTLRRTGLLNAAVAKTFTNQEARAFLEKTVVGPLSRIDDMSEWPVHTKSSWLVYGHWPPRGGSSRNPAAPTTYSARFLVPSDADAEKRFLYRALGGIKDLTEAEKFLDARWQEAYARVKGTPAGEPQIGIPGGGFLLRATDLVMLGGPLLVVVQAFFAIFWVRHWALHMNQNQATMPFIFPAFASPVDPLHRPTPRSLVEVAQRLTWLLCLVVPAAVLSFAIVTRYDLSAFTSDWQPSGISWVARLLYGRRYDGLSVFLDTLNIFGLFVSLMAMVQITTVNRSPTTGGRGRLVIRRAALFVALLLAVSIWLWSVHLERSSASLGGISVPDLIYWMSFGLTWLLASLVSLSYRARLPLVVCLLGLVIFVAMFVRT